MKAIAESEFVYTVTMHRWGDEESHSYVHGVYSEKARALDAGAMEKEYRGGNKYWPEVMEFDLNNPRHQKKILSRSSDLMAEGHRKDPNPPTPNTKGEA